MPYFITGASGEPQAFYMLIGLMENGRWDVLGFWTIGADFSYEDMVQNIMDRGVEAIDLIFIDGNSELIEVFGRLLPDAVICANTYLWAINNRGDNISDEEYAEMLEDLRRAYEAESVEESQRRYEEFISKWGSRYPDVVSHLNDNWQCYIDAFEKAKVMRDAGFDLEYMQSFIDAMAHAISRRNEYPSEAAFFNSMFYIMIQYFSHYMTENIV